MKGFWFFWKKFKQVWKLTSELLLVTGTSEMEQETPPAHIKCTISVLVVNFQQKYLRDWLSNVSIRFILSQNYFWIATCWLGSTDRFPWGGSPPPSWPRSSSARWQSTKCMYMVFSRQGTIGTRKILEWCAEFPENPTGRMPGRCFCHYFCMLPYLQIGFGNDLGWGLCAWQCKYSAWFAQTLASNESQRTPWTSRDQIWGDIARKRKTRPTIHTASHYSKFSRGNRERTVGGWLTDSGGLRSKHRRTQLRSK